MNLYSPASLEAIRGVGEVSLAKLREAGINSCFDLINFLPRSYQAINFVPRINQLKPGEVTIKARARNIIKRQTSRVTTLLTADLFDDSGVVQAIWFNQPYRANQLKSGEFYFTGNFDLNRGRYQLMNPSVKQVTRQNANLASNHLEPIYSQVRGLKTSFFSKIVADIKADILTLNESLPAIVVKQLNLMPRSDAMFQLHFPSSPELLAQAKARVQFESYFLASLASTINGLSQKSTPAVVIDSSAELMRDFVASLPFVLTDDQRKSIWKIMQKLASGEPMNLLLQGDVGSGKTLVAEAVSLLVAEAGYQAAILAPTEVLAQQHALSFERDLKPFNLRIASLTASSKNKTELYAKLERGEIDIIIGTHALLQDKVRFKQLALVVIDEQHRFGVGQRQAILDKAQLMPHLLAMTATPIPRSLALVIKNEVTIASLRQKPANRLPITTKLYRDRDRCLVYDQLIAQLVAGRQGFVVCGRIDESDEEQRQSVEIIYKTLSVGQLKNYRLAMLHGKMKAAEKDELIRAFKRGEIDVLISTTVIEVGVDIPNATVMIIHDAENYGLSQLHQLRGRVGRSDLPSFCYLLSSLSEANQRLQAIIDSNDGFYLSEVDLRLRGAGNIYGHEQSGWFNLELDTQIIEQAQTAVEIYLADIKARGTTIAADLKNLPELIERLAQFDRVTMLN